MQHITFFRALSVAVLLGVGSQRSEIKENCYYIQFSRHVQRWIMCALCSCKHKVKCSGLSSVAQMFFSIHASATETIVDLIASLFIFPLAESG